MFGGTIIEIQARPNTALIDDDDASKVNQYEWYSFRVHRCWYVATDFSVHGKAKRIYLHRLVMNAPDKTEVDHINGDGLDNRKENLRIVTHQQNLANQKLSEANTSGYKGVTLDQRKKKDGTSMTPTWMAQTKHNGKRIYLGKFATPELAARAYDRKMIELHGEFARTNESLGLLPPDDDTILEQNVYVGGNAKGRNRWTKS